MPHYSIQSNRNNSRITTIQYICHIFKFALAKSIKYYINMFDTNAEYIND